MVLLYKLSNVMKKYAYIFLTSLIIFQMAVVVLSGHNIRNNLGESSSRIIMNSIETSSAAVNPTVRQTLSRLCRSLNLFFNANQSFSSLKKDIFHYFLFSSSPNILDKDHLTADSEHLFLPVLDLVLLI